MNGLAKLEPRDRTSLQVSRDRPLLYDPLGRPVDLSAEAYSRQNDPTFTGRTPGPGVPLVPWLPRGDEPRQWFTAQGYNLNYVPRTEFKSLTPFIVLRALADSSDIVRVAIEDVIQQLVALEWDVHPVKESGVKADAAKSRIDRVKDFLKYPDRQHSFSRWLTMLLEECLVIDAVSLYRQRTIAGDPYALMLLDGSTIKPVVDYYGRSPEAPDTAYQQIGYGRVETEFHVPFRSPAERASAILSGEAPAELVYAPKKPRAWTPYGQSPVERVIITVNLALRRQLHYLAFYTDGNIPEAFWKCPTTWEPHQIENMQDAFEKLLDGESGRRRRLRFMPGGEGAGLENSRGADEWKKEFDEYLARVVCFAFNVSPLPLVQLMNRATSETSEEQETHSGSHPMQAYVAELLTREIQDFLEEPDLEFIWTEEKERDEKLFLEQVKVFVEGGIWNRNEVRDEQGREPIPGGDVYFVNTPTGPIPLKDLAAAPENVPAAAGRPAGDSKPPALGPAAAALDVPMPPAAGKLASRMMADLRRWRKVALKSLKTGKGRQFDSSEIPGPLADALHEWLAYSLRAGGTREDVEWGFRFLTKVRRPLVAARRRMRLERKVRAAARGHFESVAETVARLVAGSYAPRTEKLRKEGDGPTDDQVDAAMRWDVFVDAVRPTLKEAYLEGETLAEDVSGAEVAFGLTDEQATAYAEERAAELVGKRVLEDGTVIDNPNARWSIPGSVRDRLRETVTKAFDEGWTQKELQQEIESPTFWTWRSDMIARTEVATALNRGTAQVYKDAGVETVKIVDGPGCLADGHDDDLPGVSGEIWTLDEFEENPVGHPNCRRDAVPVLPGETP